MSEQWKPVIGFEKFYEISDLGNVKAMSRLLIEKTGNRRVRKEQLMKSCRGKSGHHLVKLCGKGGKLKRKSFLVHLLVLEAFVGPRPEGLLGLHYDDNKDNNALSNLRWGTPLQNVRDAIRNDKLGKKLNRFKVECIVQLLKLGISSRKLSKLFGVSVTLIEYIRGGHRWRYVTGIETDKQRPNPWEAV